MHRSMGDAKSRLRQAILDLEADRQRQLEFVLGEQGPLIRGSVGRRKRVCGYSRCRCAKGELHASSYLSAAVAGRTRMVHLPEAAVLHVGQATRRYRRFRRARAQLVRLASKLAALVDRLGNALLERYPPENPLPPALRRGRKVKDGLPRP
jgi:hypothetical protein